MLLDSKAKDSKGFSSNRFGRMGNLSTYFLEHSDLLRQFFDEMVDENQNKLVLVVSTYIRSDWFMLSCKIAKHFHDHVTLPIMQTIGIDKKENDLTDGKEKIH